MSKHKLKRSGRDKGYYTQQFAITTANKARRKGRRERRRILTLRNRMLAKIPTSHEHE